MGVPEIECVYVCVCLCLPNEQPTFWKFRESARIKLAQARVSCELLVNCASLYRAGAQLVPPGATAL